MKAKWIQYTDSWLDGPLLAGCKAVFDDEQLQSNKVELLGVACMDMNVIVDLMGTPSSFQNRQGYKNFHKAMKDEEKVCFDVAHGFLEMRQLREASVGGSVCQQCDMDSAPCPIPTSAPKTSSEDTSGAYSHRVWATPLVLLLGAALN
jgi:hypothetical protein